MMNNGQRNQTEVSRKGVLFGLWALFVMLTPLAAIAEAPAPKINRIGVISIAGGLLYDDKVGFTAFGNKLGRHDVAEWDLDDAWEEGIETALAGVMSAEIVSLSIDRATLLAAYPTEEDEKSIIAQYRMPKFKRIAESLRAIAAENHLDAILLLASDSIELAGSNQSLESFGLFRSGKKGPTYYYMIARLHLVDGATGEPMKEKWLETAKRIDGQFGKWPSAKAPDELRGKAFADYTEEEKAALAERFNALPADAYAPSLTKLFAVK